MSRTSDQVSVAATEYVVLVAAKAPRAGEVKTRLSPPATPEQAAEIAAAALLDTLEAARECGAPTVVALAGELTGAARASELEAALEHCTVIPQRGSDFADRLAHAHADTAATYPGRPVVQIGMDTPQLSATLLHLGGESLLADGVDAVLGTALDGGWWALGLRDPGQAALLRAVPMSTPETGDRTAGVLRSAGLTIASLPALGDVDTVSDVCQVRAAIPHRRFAAATAPLAQGGSGATETDTPDALGRPVDVIEPPAAAVEEAGAVEEGRLR